MPNNYKRIYVGPESQNSTTGAIVTLEDTKIDHTPAAKDTTSYGTNITGSKARVIRA